jgi:hypothetical protein
MTLCCGKIITISCPLNLLISILFMDSVMEIHFGYQIMAHLNRCYKNCWIGHCGPVPWPLRSLDLIQCDFFLWGPIKAMTCRTKVHMREELLHWIMNATANI